MNSRVQIGLPTGLFSCNPKNQLPRPTLGPQQNPGRNHHAGPAPAKGVPFLSGANSQTVRDSGAQSFGSRVKEAQPAGCGRNAVIGQNRRHLGLLGLQLPPQRPSAVRSSAASLRLYRLDAPDPLAGPGQCSGSKKCPLGPSVSILCGFTPISHGSLDR